MLWISGKGINLFNNNPMPYKLFLDDTRTPQNVYEKTKDAIYLEGNEEGECDWVIVRNYNEFTLVIRTIFEKGDFPSIVSFDHDLAKEHIEYYFNNGGHANPPDPANANFTEKTGLDCAKWLVEFCEDNKLELPEYKVHSRNLYGKKNILDYLEKQKKQ